MQTKFLVRLSPPLNSRFLIRAMLHSWLMQALRCRAALGWDLRSVSSHMPHFSLAFFIKEQIVPEELAWAAMSRAVERAGVVGASADALQLIYLHQLCVPHTSLQLWPAHGCLCCREVADFGRGQGEEQERCLCLGLFWGRVCFCWGNKKMDLLQFHKIIEL